MSPIDYAGSSGITTTVPQRVFLSHTSDLGRHTEPGSFVAAAVEAALRARHTVTDMVYFAARDTSPAAVCVNRHVIFEAACLPSSDRLNQFDQALCRLITSDQYHHKQDDDRSYNCYCLDDRTPGSDFGTQSTGQQQPLHVTISSRRSLRQLAGV